MTQRLNRVTQSFFALCISTMSINLIALALDYPEVKLEVVYVAELTGNNEALNAKLLRAARQGAFYLEMPSVLKERLDVGFAFAHSWYRNEHLKGFPFKEPSGYFPIESCQGEHLICRQEYWHDIYDSSMRELIDCFVDTGLLILEKLFPLVIPQLPRDLWQLAAPGVFDKTGSFFFSFNHYRADRKVLGLTPHKDTSHITLLYIDADGLIAFIDNTWQAIAPKPGFLVVMVGRALELLVGDSARVTAPEHFVKQIVNHDRVSFALFIDNYADSPVNTVSQNGMIHPVYASYDEYSQAICKMIRMGPNHQ